LETRNETTFIITAKFCMKSKLVLSSVVWFCACSPIGFAQDNGDTASATNAAPVTTQDSVITTEGASAETDTVVPAPQDQANPDQPPLTQTEPDSNLVPVVPSEPDPEAERGPLTLDHELPAAIQFLARMADINIFIDPAITFTSGGAEGEQTVPTVSLRWDNVTAEDALHEVLDIYGLALMYNPRTGISRVVKKPTVAPLVQSILELQHTNPTNLVEMIQASFSEPARSKVIADARTSQLLIVSPERDLDAITNLLAKMDLPVQQVLIEARLLETAKNPSTIKGIDWSGTLEGQNFTFGNGFTSGTTRTTDGATVNSVLPSGRTVSSAAGERSTTDLTTALGSGGISLDTMRGFFPTTAFLNADGVSAVLSFLNKDNDTEVVATPRAVTTDNQTARLEVTRAFPIFKITPGSSQTPAGAEVTYTNVGTILEVTPRISANSNIALRVIPEVSNIDSKDRQIVNGVANEANVYGIRRMEANVVIPSGNTLVMGGLISDNQSSQHTKVPVLGDMPFFGRAFRKDAKARSKVNLLIFVTPTIVRQNDFQPTPTDFLQTKLMEPSDVEETAWDRGKPANWFKNSRRKN